MRFFKDPGNTRPTDFLGKFYAGHDPQIVNNGVKYDHMLNSHVCIAVKGELENLYLIVDDAFLHVL